MFMAYAMATLPILTVKCSYTFKHEGRYSWCQRHYRPINRGWPTVLDRNQVCMLDFSEESRSLFHGTQA